MTDRKGTPQSNFALALEAIDNLATQDLSGIFHGGQMSAMIAHDEIQLAPINLKTSIFYRHLLPLRKDLISLLANSYRLYFKLGMAHPGQAGSNSDKWACSQLQPTIDATLEWIRDWYILACDGENQSVRHSGQIAFVPNQTVSLSVPLAVAPFPPSESWRAPAWLFQISLAYVGVGPLKTKHVPANDSEERLGAAHTRLLLKGARQMFLWQFGAATERVRNEETAAAGAISVQTVAEGQFRDTKKPKYWLKGIEGLNKKANLLRYMQGLTEKQQMAASLKWEYGLGLTEIASRMGINRKTAHEHIESAKKKMEEALSSDKRSSNRAKDIPEF